MAKRFIDTGLFEDSWFMDLSKDGKLLWIYMITRCDHAGIIELNRRLVTFQTDIKDLNKVIQELMNRLVTLDEEFNVFFIPKFISFQYPDFPQSNVNQQKGAIKQLEKYGLFKDGKLIDFKSSGRVNEELVNSYGNDNGNVYGKGKRNISSKSMFQKPTIEEVQEYFKANGYSIDAGKKAFNYYDVAGWKDSKGQQVRNWKQKMQSVWFKDENKEKPKSLLDFPA